MPNPLKVLSVEDSGDDLLLLQREFKKGGLDAEFTRVDTPDTFRSALAKNNWDLVLCDFSMPHFSGLEALHAIRNSGLELPVIFVSGTMGEEIAVDVMLAGANDYMVKGHLNRLVPAVTRELRDMQERRARKQAERRLTLVDFALNHVREAAFLIDEHAAFHYVNDEACRSLGYPREELLRLRVADVDPDFPPERWPAHWREVRAAGALLMEGRHRAKDGRLFPVEIAPNYFEYEGTGYILAMVRDITERKQMEKQYLHAQRLEAVGTLASGVAHDLNNILTPMLMATGLLRPKLAAPEDREILSLFERGAQRGADIIRQLLMFSRGGEGLRSTLRLGPLLKETEHIMQETFPRNIRIGVASPDDLWNVVGDTTQLHQVLMNLCVNARDAMPKGGNLALAARNLTLAPADIKIDPQAKEGPYVVITVADTGTGIPPEILRRIFDPFFTTKGIGKGSGLGLSTVLGIVKKHGGFVHVDTEPGHGSKFSIYLPAAPDASAPPPPASETPIHLGNGETVLVVDDEAPIRTLLRRILELHGYRVHTAENGREATTLLQRHHREIRLVLTDLMMPEMDGMALARAAKTIAPGIPVIATSGLDDDVNREQLRTLGVEDVLMKPFERDLLLERIHRTLHPPP